MKIKVEEGLDKSYLENGRHVVEITEVTEGESEYNIKEFLFSIVGSKVKKVL